MSDAPCRHGFHRGRCLAPACEFAPPPPRSPTVSASKAGPRQSDRLTAAEADRLRELVHRDGIAAVARRCGVSQITLARAMALLATSRLTTNAIRIALSKHGSEAAAE